jgi:hypothetical protein
MRKNVLRFLLFFSFVALGLGVNAQVYYRGQDNSKKYYVAFSYGVGNAQWQSRFQNTFLYNTNGSVLEAGDMTMKASNPTFNYNFNVCFPVGDKRIGLGISFEKFSMDKLSIISLSDTSGTNVNIPNSYIYFRESFWFNKLYLMVQLPFHFCENKPYSLDFVACGGFYGYDGLKHLNFFGDDQIASTLFSNVSFIFDYDIKVEHARLFIQPMAEYKYFHNNGNEYPSTIVHNIFSYSINFGVRFDVSKF